MCTMWVDGGEINIRIIIMLLWWWIVVLRSGYLNNIKIESDRILVPDLIPIHSV